MHRPHNLLTLCCAILLIVPTSFPRSDELFQRPLERCWTYETGSLTPTPPASDNAFTVFLPESPSSLSALSLLTGQVLWTVQIGGNVISAPILDRNRVTIAALSADEPERRSLRIFSIDTLSGVSTGGKATAVDPGAAAIAVGGEIAFLRPDGGITLVSANAAARGLNAIDGVYAGISSYSDLVFSWTDLNEAVLIDPSSKPVVTRFELPSKPSGAFSADHENIYVGTEDGFVIAVERNSGETLWSSRTGGRIDKLTAVDGGVLAASRDNFVYLLADGNGSRTWKRKLAGRILGSALAGEDVAVFLSYGTNEAVVVRLSDGKLVNNVKVKEAEYFVSAPVIAGDYLLIPHNKGLSAYGPKEKCQSKRDGLK